MSLPDKRKDTDGLENAGLVLFYILEHLLGGLWSDLSVSPKGKEKVSLLFQHRLVSPSSLPSRKISRPGRHEHSFQRSSNLIIREWRVVFVFANEWKDERGTHLCCSTRLRCRRLVDEFCRLHLGFRVHHVYTLVHGVNFKRGLLELCL